MASIEQMAEEYAKSTLVGSPYVKRNAYIQGALDVLKKVSTASDLKTLIEELKGNLEI